MLGPGPLGIFFVVVGYIVNENTSIDTGELPVWYELETCPRLDPAGASFRLFTPRGHGSARTGGPELAAGDGGHHAATDGRVR